MVYYIRTEAGDSSKDIIIMRERRTQKMNSRGQTALEYLLLLAVVTAVILGGIHSYLNRARDSSEVYFNRIVNGIYGRPAPIGIFSFEGNNE